MGQKRHKPEEIVAKLRQVPRRAKASGAGTRHFRSDSAHGGGNAARDIGEQALMRGSKPHVHIFVRGWSSLTTGVGIAGHKALTEISLSPPRPRRHARLRGLVSLDQTSIGSIRTTGLHEAGQYPPHTRVAGLGDAAIPPTLATATAWLFFETSNPTKTSLFSSMVRPPGLRPCSPNNPH